MQKSAFCTGFPLRLVLASMYFTVARMKLMTAKISEPALNHGQTSTALPRVLRTTH
jgi:hypothetical protein